MKNILKRCTVAALVVNAGSAAAGGLWLNEFGDFSSGRAAAGSVAGVDDPMTMAYNPASITRLDGNQLFAAAGAIVGNMNFDINYTTPRLGTDDGGNAGETAPFASMAYVQDLDSDKWSAGIGLATLSGAGIDYSDNWAGRYQATKVALLATALAPTLAYRVNDQLSLGASVQIYYADLDVDVAVPRPDPRKADGQASVDGNDIKPGFTLGALYELSEVTRFGVFYQSELKPEFDGDLKINVANVNVGELDEIKRNISTDTELTMGQYVRFGVHQDMDERWAVDFTVGWDNWSALNDVVISTAERGVSATTDWHDTYHVAWGAQYKWDKYWTFTGGIAYDTNPVSSQDRDAILPVDKQIRYAVGTQYALSDSLTVGGYVNYMDLGSAQITSKNYGGSFDYNNATQLIANMTWKF